MNPANQHVVDAWTPPGAAVDGPCLCGREVWDPRDGERGRSRAPQKTLVQTRSSWTCCILKLSTDKSPGGREAPNCDALLLPGHSQRCPPTTVAITTKLSRYYTRSEDYKSYTRHKRRKRLHGAQGGQADHLAPRRGLRTKRSGGPGGRGDIRRTAV